MGCKPHKRYKIFQYLVKSCFVLRLVCKVQINGVLNFDVKILFLPFYVTIGKFGSDSDNHEAVMCIPLLEITIPMEKTTVGDVETSNQNLGFCKGA